MAPACDAETLRHRLDTAPMTPARWTAVGLTLLISALDGYDVLAMTLAAPSIASEWSIGRTALGTALAAGLAGMAAGSFLIAPVADRTGRRTIVLAALGLMASGTLGSALSGSLATLIAWRFVTGLGIGACMAVINTLAAEYANARWRSLAVACMAVGYPIGGMLGGVAGTMLAPRFGWQAIFLSGAVAAMILLPVVAVRLPESVMFLAASRRPRRMVELNAVLGRFGLPPVADVEASIVRHGYARIFDKDHRAPTLRMASVGFFLGLAIYFGLTWMPQMLVDAGFSHAAAGLFSTISGASGIVGGLAVGFCASRWGAVPVVSCVMCALGLALALVGAMPARVPVMIPVVTLVGLSLFGSAAGLYAALAAHFPDEARAAGCGFAIGVARVASVIAPMLAGWMFAEGFSRFAVCVACALCAVIAGAILGGDRLLGRLTGTPRTQAKSDAP